MKERQGRFDTDTERRKQNEDRCKDWSVVVTSQEAGNHQKQEDAKKEVENVLTGWSDLLNKNQVLPELYRPPVPQSRYDSLFEEGERK